MPARLCISSWASAGQRGLARVKYIVLETIHACLFGTNGVKRDGDSVSYPIMERNKFFELGCCNSRLAVDLHLLQIVQRLVYAFLDMTVVKP